jgi:hypothetical protein
VTLDATVGFRAFGRSLWFTDDFFQRLRPYRLTLAPAAVVALEWYPAAASRGPASWFGLVLGGEYGFGFSSADAQGRAYATAAYGFSAGVRARRTLGRAELGLTVAYVHQVFAIDRGTAEQAPPEGIPNVAYQSVRLGLSARIRLATRFALTAATSYLAVVSAGEIDGPDYFPRSFVGGVEASLGAAVPIARGFEARADLAWRRYFHDMNVVPGDRLVAGGAADDFYAATLGVAFRR